MSNDGPLISVIIPTFNRSEVFKRAISSVLAQSYKNYELIIVDDGSTDNTSSVIQEIFSESTKDSKNLIYCFQENKGVSAARNYGVSRSRGSWLAFLDSDDEWFEKKLELQVKKISESTCRWVHGEEIWIRNGVRVNQRKIHQKSGGDIFCSSLNLCLVSPSTVMIDRETFINAGRFDEDFIVCEDYDLWLKLSLNNQIEFIETPLIKKYGGHQDQLSAKYKAMDFWRVKSMMRILSSEEITGEKKDQVIKVALKKCEILLNGYKKHNNMNNYDEVDHWHRTLCNINALT